MRILLQRAIALLIIVGTSALCQNPQLVDPVTHQVQPLYITAGLYNGHFWVRAEQEEAFKTGIILGIMEAFSYADEKGNTKSWFPWALTTGETRARIDSFYSDPKNLNIPVVWALGIVATQLADGDFATLLSSERKMANEAHTVKP
jgi:hypothetical protein